MQERWKKMTTGKYRNYQEFYANYLGGWSFADGDQILTIKDVEEQEVRIKDKDSGTEVKLTVTFQETDLPLVLNRTNADMIAKVTGTSFTGDWIGKKIKVGTSKVRAFGDVWDAVRVRDEKITAAASEPATEAQIRRIHELAEDGQINMSGLFRYYKIGDLSDLTKKQAADMIRAKTGEVVE